MNRYSNFFDVVCFRRMHTDGNKLKLQDLLRERCKTDVADWVKGWIHWGGCSALDCRCVGKEMNLTFMQCREEVDYELQLVELLAWMRGRANSLGDKTHLD